MRQQLQDSLSFLTAGEFKGLFTFRGSVVFLLKPYYRHSALKYGRDKLSEARSNGDPDYAVGPRGGVDKVVRGRFRGSKPNLIRLILVLVKGLDSS